MQTSRSTFSTRLNVKNQEADTKEDANITLKDKVLQMNQEVLQESHDQSGALLLSEPMSQLNFTGNLCNCQLLPQRQVGAYLHGTARQFGQDSSHITEVCVLASMSLLLT